LTAAVPRLRIVAVLGSGDPGHGNASLAFEVGRLVADAGHHLLTGGGQGVMADACRGFAGVEGRKGLSIGILPRQIGGPAPKQGYPNPWVEIPIVTHLAGEEGPASPSSRNPINVFSAWRIVALPGGAGTIAELRLAARAGATTLVLQPAEARPEEAAFRRAVSELGLEALLIPPLASLEWAPAWQRLRAFLGCPQR